MFLQVYNFLIILLSAEIIFETCSGLYLFNSLIEGRLLDKYIKYIIIIKEQVKVIKSVFLNTLFQIVLLWLYWLVEIFDSKTYLGFIIFLGSSITCRVLSSIIFFSFITSLIVLPDLKDSYAILAALS